jgi:hypothetical protein
MVRNPFLSGRSFAVRREYKRLFGQPPVRDMERLREVARR